jgi:hypothetical protein
LGKGAGFPKPASHMKRIARDQVTFTNAEWRLLARTLDLLRQVEDALGRGPDDGRDAWDFMDTFEQMGTLLHSAEGSLERIVAKHYRELPAPRFPPLRLVRKH